ncbi:MAG: hypothetical protein LAO20_12530 [Acidobacteriia bacterium]|nr:hypothetical protein [Terriglobia bacterium]
MITLRTSSCLKAWTLVVLPVFLALAVPARPQTFSRGVPASVSSPEPDGRQHGIPASVVSPNAPGVNAQGRPVFHQRGPLRRFGPREPRHNVLVPLPIFYPVYVDGSYQVADPYVPAQPDARAADAAESEPSRDRSTAREDELRQAYLQGAREAMAQEQEAARNSHRSVASSASDDPPRRKRAQDEAVSAPPKEDNSPSAVFIFKDGHKLETRNFAIMGTTLYDLSSSTVKKVSLVDLNKDATIKENDDRGIQIKLP